MLRGQSVHVGQFTGDGAVYYSLHEDHHPSQHMGDVNSRAYNARSMRLQTQGMIEDYLCLQLLPHYTHAIIRKILSITHQAHLDPTTEFSLIDKRPRAHYESLFV